MPEHLSATSLIETWRVYRRFWPYVRPDLRYMALGYLTIVAAVLTNTVMIWLIGMPFNLLQDEDYDKIALVLLIFAVVVAFNQAVQYAGGMLARAVGLRTIGRLRNAMLARLLSLSFPVIGRIPKGDLLARLGSDVDRLKACVVDAPLYLGSHLLTIAIYVSMLFWIDTWLSFIALAIIPVYAVHQRFFAKRKRRASEQFLKENGALLAFEDEALSNTRSISAAMADDFVSRLHQRAFDRARFWAMKDRRLDHAFSTTFSLLIYLTGLIIVLMGIEGVLQERFGPGALISFLLYLGYLTVPARGTAEIFFQCAGHIAAGQRVCDLFDQAHAVRELPGARPLTVTAGVIELRDVSFAYGDGKRLYNGIHATIAGGETTALVGPSGVGKSTLAILLMRFYDPTEGRILIDGCDIREATLSSLRGAIAIVWQEPFLVSGTVRDNLLMVRPSADAHSLLAACAASHASEFIDRLPEGLDTLVGPRGVVLSAGQKQRLAIAQAFLRDAPILILDEATSALDSHSEQVVVQALNTLRRGRTTLVIAHRYSSIKSAHRVMYFNGDGTVTMGRHEELMATHPRYRAAVEWQTGERLAENIAV